VLDGWGIATLAPGADGPDCPVVRPRQDAGDDLGRHVDDGSGILPVKIGPVPARTGYGIPSQPRCWSWAARSRMPRISGDSGLITRKRYASPWLVLGTPETGVCKVFDSKGEILVDDGGIEPPTSALRTQRSPN
jgi:hypothetical protein